MTVVLQGMAVGCKEIVWREDLLVVLNFEFCENIIYLKIFQSTQT
jgi:hypothetical protein